MYWHTPLGWCPQSSQESVTLPAQAQQAAGGLLYHLSPTTEKKCSGVGRVIVERSMS